MANTVNILSHANTFSEWLIATNALIKENNDFAQNNFVKTANTLFLNGQAIGLSVANNATVGGQLTVYSSTVQNILQVSGESAFTNANASITTTGRVNVGGTLFANSLFVANTSNFSGPIIVANTINATGNVTLTNHLYVTSNAVFSSNVDVRNGTINSRNIRNELNTNTASLTVTGAGTIGTNLTVGGQLSVGGQLTAAGNFIISGNTSYDAVNFTLGASNITATNGSIQVNRGTTGANAAIRWNESIKHWEVRDVDIPNNYYEIISEGGSYSNPAWITSLAGSKISGNISGNAGTVTNGVYTSGSYSDPAWITSLAGSKISGETALSNTATYLATNVQKNVITGKITSLSMDTSSTVLGSFVCRSTGTGDTNLAGLTFHNDSYSIKLGVRADGVFGLGGWSRTAWSWYSDSSGNMVAAGNVTAYSDPRLKENFVKIEKPLQIIQQLDGGTFNWKSGIPHTQIKAGRKDYGVLANQIENVMPEIVTDSIEINGEKYKTVAYEKLVPVLIEAIKELKAEIDELKKNQS